MFFWKKKWQTIDSGSNDYILGRDSANNSKYVRITFAPGVKRITRKSFSNCQNLERVLIPATVREIGELSFSNCPKLKEVIFEDISSLRELSDSAFDKTPLLEQTGDFVTFGSYLFRYNKDEDCVTIPDYIEEIGERVFLRKNLKKIEFSDRSKCSRIREYAFFNCQNLKELILPESMRRIDKYAFSKCSHMLSVKINDDIEEVYMDVFHECDRLFEVQYPKKLNDAKGNPPYCLFGTPAYARYKPIDDNPDELAKFADLLKEKPFEELKQKVIEEAGSKEGLLRSLEDKELYDYVKTNRAVGCSGFGYMEAEDGALYMSWYCWPYSYKWCALMDLYFLEKTRSYGVKNPWIAFELVEEGLFTDEDKKMIVEFSAITGYRTSAFIMSERGGFCDLLTGERYCIRSEYAGYSHDGSEDYYDLFFEKSKIHSK